MTPPKIGRALAEKISGSRTVTIPDSGHMMMCGSTRRRARCPDRLLRPCRSGLIHPFSGLGSTPQANAINSARMTTEEKLETLFAKVRALPKERQEQAIAWP